MLEDKNTLSRMIFKVYIAANCSFFFCASGQELASFFAGEIRKSSGGFVLVPPAASEGRKAPLLLCENEVLFCWLCSLAQLHSQRSLPFSSCLLFNFISRLQCCKLKGDDDFMMMSSLYSNSIVY